MKTRRTDDAGDMIDARGSGGRVTRRAGAGGLGLTGVLIVIAIQLLSGGKFDVSSDLDPSSALGPGSVPVAESKEDDTRAEFSGASPPMCRMCGPRSFSAVARSTAARRSFGTPAP